MQHQWGDPKTGYKPSVRPGVRIGTGIGPQHAGATPVRVLVGNYAVRIEPNGRGLNPAPVKTYLG